MSDIDWSKAPEGATHYDRNTGVFYRCDEMHSDGPKAQFWTGEGLPPVGTTCEAWHNGSAQGVVEVRYAGDFMVLWNVELKHEQCSAAKDYSFRPIRTPGQIAAEEREKEVAAMLALDPYLPTAPMGMMSRADFCRALYDAGYRKTEGGEG